MMLSEQIKHGRKALNMSQADLAEAIWVSRNTVCNWETGSTTPDIQSLVLMSALFGVTVDDMVKGDDAVMAQAIARDRNHILLAGPTVPDGSGAAEPKLDLFDLHAIGSSVYGKFESTDITEAGALAFRLVRVASFFSRGLYYLVDDTGRRIGSISRKHALHHPVYQVRMNGFDRVQLRREIRIDGGYKDVIRFDGEGISVSGNLMGDDFEIMRHGAMIASIHVRPARNRVAYGIELTDEATTPLVLGIVLTIMMLRNYDQVWVRGAGARSASAS